jgi:hypothetical protein
LPKPKLQPPYFPRRKFNSKDDILIVSETTSRRINFVLQDMGASNISGEMLKNPRGDKKTRSSVQKQPPIEDTKNKIVQKKPQVTTLRKRG